MEVKVLFEKELQEKQLQMLILQEEKFEFLYYDLFNFLIRKWLLTDAYFTISFVHFVINFILSLLTSEELYVIYIVYESY